METGHFTSTETYVDYTLRYTTNYIYVLEEIYLALWGGEDANRVTTFCRQAYTSLSTKAFPGKFLVLDFSARFF